MDSLFLDNIIRYMPVVVLLAGWVMDVILGDPERLPHPIVYFGKWIAFGEKHLNRGKHRKAKGAAFAVTSIVMVYVVTWFVLGALGGAVMSVTSPGFSTCILAALVVIAALAVFFCLAGHTLRKEVRMVFHAVDRSIDDGRKQVARIVGRDTSALDAQEIRTAALETLAENLSDGVIAPLFWYVILGVPGMLTYKMINTLDSMIGYHSERYKDFGCWAARIDDIANYIPARLTAMLMVTVAPLCGKWQVWRYTRFVSKFCDQHASPNSGWPESALAAVLDCRFGGPHNYFGEYFYKPYIGTNPRPLTTADMKKSIRLCLLAECLAILIAVLLGM